MRIIFLFISSFIFPMNPLPPHLSARELEWIITKAIIRAILAIVLGALFLVWIIAFLISLLEPDLCIRVMGFVHCPHGDAHMLPPAP